MSTVSARKDMARSAKEKACKVCKGKFTPRSTTQRVCSPLCAGAVARSDRLKAQRKAEAKVRAHTRKQLEAMKSVPKLMDEADRAFMTYTRIRDRIAGCACISSGKPLDWTGNRVDAGHYRSRGAASHLRYDERNCHAQSKHDNRYLSGNIAAYRVLLIERIGIDAVESLENNNCTHKWTREELREIRDTYRQKARDLKKEHGL